MARAATWYSRAEDVIVDGKYKMHISNNAIIRVSFLSGLYVVAEPVGGVGCPIKYICIVLHGVSEDDTIACERNDAFSRGGGGDSLFVSLLANATLSQLYFNTNSQNTQLTFALWRGGFSFAFWFCSLDNRDDFAVQRSLYLPIPWLHSPPLFFHFFHPLIRLSLDMHVNNTLPLFTRRRSIDKHNQSSLFTSMYDFREILDQSLQPMYFEGSAHDQEQIRPARNIVCRQLADIIPQWMWFIV